MMSGKSHLALRNSFDWQSSKARTDFNSGVLVDKYSVASSALCNALKILRL